MSHEITPLRPRAYVGPASLGPSKALVRALGRYHPSLRGRLRRFAIVGKPCADLLVSFPAAAALIATAERGAAATGRAVALVKAGASLKAVAEALSVPLWTRKLPPEAFTPEPLGPVGGDEDFARRAAHLIPKPPENAAMWLAWVLAAQRLGAPGFVAWIASRALYQGAPIAVEAVELFAAYAWSARHARRDWCARPSTPAAPTAKVASQAAEAVRHLLNERCAILDGSSGWTRTSTVGGFRFAPLTSAEELKSEAATMRNCLDTYVRPVARGESLIFAMRRGGRSVASIELRPKRAMGEFHLVQFEGPANGPPPPKSRKALDKWMRGLGPCPVAHGGLMRKGRLDGRKWRDAWAGFAEAHPAASPLWSETDPQRILTELRRRLALLESCVKRERQAMSR
ncbi:MAG: PcfJ domain-containing protein [Pseudomonadota bacterium]